MEHIVRDRLLTAEEAARDRDIRDLIEAEKPELIQRIRQRLSDLASEPSPSPQETGDMEETRTESPKHARIDGQKTGLAGEFFVAAELLKRGFQTSVTFGNAKAIDLVAIHPETGRVFTIQVKALRYRNFFHLDFKRIERDQVYVFAILNKPGESVQYFIVPGAVLADEPDRFGKDAYDPKCPGINWSQLQEFADRWTVFDQAP